MLGSLSDTMQKAASPSYPELGLTLFAESRSPTDGRCFRFTGDSGEPDRFVAAVMNWWVGVSGAEKEMARFPVYGVAAFDGDDFSAVLKRNGGSSQQTVTYNQASEHAGRFNDMAYNEYAKWCKDNRGNPPVTWVKVTSDLYEAWIDEQRKISMAPVKPPAMEISPF